MMQGGIFLCTKTKRELLEKLTEYKPLEIPKNELRFWTPGGWVLDEEYAVYVGSNSEEVQEVSA